MTELSPESGVHSKCRLLRMTGNSLDIHLHITFQQLVDLTVVVIIIPAHTYQKPPQLSNIYAIRVSTFPASDITFYLILLLIPKTYHGFQISHLHRERLKFWLLRCCIINV